MLLVGPAHPSIYGEQPLLDRVGENDNLVAAVDMTEYCATTAESGLASWPDRPCPDRLSHRGSIA